MNKWLIVDQVPGAEIGYRGIVEQDGTTVCLPSPMGEDAARLIAAAPDLLDALKNLTRLSIWRGASDYDRQQVNAARALINEIEGV